MTLCQKVKARLNCHMQKMAVGHEQILAFSRCFTTCIPIQGYTAFKKNITLVVSTSKYVEHTQLL